MLKSLGLLPLFAFLLSSCQSLPKPEQDQGLLVFQSTVENTTEKELLARYKVVLNDGDATIWLYGSSGLVFRALPAGSYEVTRVEAVANMANVTEGTPLPLEAVFEILPGQITYFPLRLHIVQVHKNGNKRHINQYQEWRPLSTSDKYKIRSEILRKEGADLWINNVK